jgi:hypothetical protein
MKRNYLAFAFVAVCFACAAKFSSAAVLAYEGFDYPNDGPTLLNGLAGGTGWGGPWTFSGAAATGNDGFDVSLDNNSLTTTGFPFAPAGDRVLAVGLGTGGNSARADRLLPTTVDLSVDGNVLYASFLIQKTTSGGTSNDNIEVNFLAGLGTGSGSTPIRFGSTSSERLFIHDGGSVPAESTYEDMTLTTNYFTVIKIESRATDPDIYSVLTYSGAETVPMAEPVTWDRSHSPATPNNVIINGIRLWIGVLTAGEFDEIRIGQTWADVTAPTVTAHAGDFDSDGDVDGADFVAWQTNFPKASDATLAQGDADGDGDVDGADFVVWQTNFPFTPGGGASPIPEPGSIVLTIFGLFGIAVVGRNFRRGQRGTE